MEIKVLGAGCEKCKALEKVTRDTVEKFGIDATVEKVEDIIKIMQLGTITVPALMVDGQIVLKGKIPTEDELSKLLIK